MPAAAVIPAPIAYIKIAAVKASVVEFRSIRMDSSSTSCDCSAVRFELGKISEQSLVFLVTLSKLECSNQAKA